jgi:hypothetical protein
MHRTRAIPPQVGQKGLKTLPDSLLRCGHESVTDGLQGFLGGRHNGWFQRRTSKKDAS